MNDNFSKRLMSSKHFRVTIFGSARIKKNDKVYKQIYQLAKSLGKEHIDVITGGGPGLMEAANAGHKAGANGNGSHSIGMGIKLPHEQHANSSVEIYKEFKRFSTRLDNFMLYSNAVVVADGGVGTMLELFYTWQLMQVNQTCHIPLVLLGDMWEGLLKWLHEPLEKKYFGQADFHLLFHAKSHKEAKEIILDAHESFKEGGPDFCINYSKYRVRF